MHKKIIIIMTKNKYYNKIIINILKIILKFQTYE